MLVDLENSFFNLSENLCFIENCASISRDTPSKTQTKYLHLCCTGPLRNSTVFLTFYFPTKHGPGSWKFNNSLLLKRKWVYQLSRRENTRIRQQILVFTRQRVSLLGDGKNGNSCLHSFTLLRKLFSISPRREGIALTKLNVLQERTWLQLQIVY